MSFTINHEVSVVLQRIVLTILNNYLFLILLRAENKIMKSRMWWPHCICSTEGYGGVRDQEFKDNPITVQL